MTAKAMIGHYDYRLVTKDNGMWRQLFPSPLPHVIPTKMYRKNSPRFTIPNV